jgi:hypothetical protein
MAVVDADIISAVKTAYLGAELRLAALASTVAHIVQYATKYDIIRFDLR